MFRQGLDQLTLCSALDQFDPMSDVGVSCPKQSRRNNSASAEIITFRLLFSTASPQDASESRHFNLYTRVPMFHALCVRVN